MLEQLYLAGRPTSLCAVPNCRAADRHTRAVHGNNRRVAYTHRPALSFSHHPGQRRAFADAHCDATHAHRRPRRDAHRNQCTRLADAYGWSDNLGHTSAAFTFCHSAAVHSQPDAGTAFDNASAAYSHTGSGDRNVRSTGNSSVCLGDTQWHGPTMTHETRSRKFALVA